MVLYDVQEHRQTMLQGHTNGITGLATTDDRTLIASADAGPAAQIILWDANSATPLRTLPSPTANGFAALDITPDGRQLMTISSPDSTTGQQQLAVWDLSSPAKTPVTQAVIPVGDAQHWVRFNPADPSELVSNGKQRVYFWTLQQPYSSNAASAHTVQQSGSMQPSAAPLLKFFSPPLVAADFKQAVGQYTVSAFVPRTVQVRQDWHALQTRLPATAISCHCTPKGAAVLLHAAYHSQVAALNS